MPLWRPPLSNVPARTSGDRPFRGWYSGFGLLNGAPSTAAIEDLGWGVLNGGSVTVSQVVGFVPRPGERVRVLSSLVTASGTVAVEHSFLGTTGGGLAQETTSPQTGQIQLGASNDSYVYAAAPSTYYDPSGIVAPDGSLGQVSLTDYYPEAPPVVSTGGGYEAPVYYSPPTYEPPPPEPGLTAEEIAYLQYQEYLNSLILDIEYQYGSQNEPGYGVG